ncbi:hypothetical protein F5884DRAFT_881435 [Xylogone sp. PMI_703]|nr:hypothetical protein F5884DRAFT_881435 [Xylogone sp. PMI_703]
MTLLATFTNLELQLEPGVNGSNIHENAKPQDSGILRPEQLGCWRGHANAWRKVIEENIETAIIVEDDADWDVNIHDIFRELSKQMRKGELRKERPSREEMRRAPYGLDWDLLYIGSCWDLPNEDNRPKHQTYDDPFAPNSQEMSGSYRNELEGWGVKLAPNTRMRVLAPSWYSVCTIGYAVTRQGAQKLLYTVGNGEGLNSPIDLAMSDRIQKGYLRAYTVIPPLVTPWKTGTVSDSDIDDLRESTEELKTGSENLKNSAREAIKAAYITAVKEGFVQGG